MKTDNHQILIRILSYLKPYIKHFILIGILLSFSTIIGFIQPLVIQHITDDGMVQKSMSIIISSSAILVLLVVSGQVISIAQSYFFANIHNTSYSAIFHQVFHKLLRMKKSYFEDKNNSEILSSLQMDVSQVASITDQYVTNTVSYLFKIISGLIGLSVISWQLTLLVIAMVPIKIILVKYFSKRQEKAMEDMIDQSREFSQWFGDIVNGVDEVKLWGLADSCEKKFSARQQRLLRLQKGNTMISCWNGFWESLLEWSVTIFLYLIGGVMVCNGTLSIGSVFAFASYSWYVTGPVAALINLKMMFARILPSARRLFAFLDAEPEKDDGRDSIALVHPPKLELQNVKFDYDGTRSILNGIHLTINPGEKIAIIGQNGSGKSTILNLLLRFFEPKSGQILVNGLPADRFSLEEYRSMFSVVSQEPYLFLGNILENVDLKGGVQEAKMEKVLRESGVESFLERMPDGAKTRIGVNGAKLSGGEKQKLAVARALLKDAPIVILDEATSGFDVESRQYLHDVIMHEMKDKTVIMITHHYDSLDGMDRVYRLDNGFLQPCKTSIVGSRK